MAKRLVPENVSITKKDNETIFVFDLWINNIKFNVRLPVKNNRLIYRQMQRVVSQSPLFPELMVITYGKMIESIILPLKPLKNTKAIARTMKIGERKCC